MTGSGFFSRRIYLGKSDPILANIAAGDPIPGLSEDADNNPRVFDAIYLIGSEYQILCRILPVDAGDLATTQSLVIRLQGAPGNGWRDAYDTDLWVTVKDTAAHVTEAGEVSQTTGTGPFPPYIQIVSGGITAADWGSGVTVEVWIWGA